MNHSKPPTDYTVSLPQSDALARLPGRIHLVNALESSIAFSDEQEGLIAVFLIDFDALDRFNYVFGVDVDDRLMLALVQSIRELIGEEALLARVGNYQLAVAQEELPSPESAEVLALKLQHLFSEPVSMDENLFYVTASIGISLYPLDATDAYTLLKTAENTMRRVQRKGKNLFAFTRKFSGTKYDRHARLMRDLPAAIENGELYFAYQCQYSYQEERCVGAEMLARWQHPEYGDVAPAQFIPLAEQSGMIGPLTVRAMVEASRMFRELEAVGRADLSLSINISPVFLMTRDFIETVRFMLENYALENRPLHFEITEELMIHYPEQLVETFRTLREMNIGVEIDDFGTGYTSLKYLTDIPMDRLKVDRSFVRRIDKDARRRALFKAIVDMAGAFGVGVIAEGVEQSAEAEALRAFSLVSVQGFYIGKPVSAGQFLSECIR